jgi:hypothetical protein
VPTGESLQSNYVKNIKICFNDGHYVDDKKICIIDISTATWMIKIYALDL